MNVDASELNSALLDLWTAVNGEQAALPHRTDSYVHPLESQHHKQWKRDLFFPT